MSGQWMPVDLDGKWANPKDEDTVNVGDKVSVIALLWPDRLPTWDDNVDGRYYPTHALVIRHRYVGSDHYPPIVTENEIVRMNRLVLTP